ncbi:hypothetical protein FGO68_gene4675 [Halteria grandinella]|uniref:Uncharacterized protein n=1 Tax=Halteria grandinella TaxID=5974 RepID=A0A8J8NVH0_HALGN|nr:hypothetical protein FGO68_gene4675 [Halteria grandinella]
MKGTNNWFGANRKSEASPGQHARFGQEKAFQNVKVMPRSSILRHSQQNPDHHYPAKPVQIVKVQKSYLTNHQARQSIGSFPTPLSAVFYNSVPNATREPTQLDGLSFFSDTTCHSDLMNDFSPSTLISMRFGRQDESFRGMENIYVDLKLKYKQHEQKIKSKLDQSGVWSSSKRLFSLFRTYDFNRGEHVPMMHVYKRNLSPLKENYSIVSSASPYQDNFLVFSNSEGGLFDTMSHFKQQYLTSNENVKVIDGGSENARSKNFQTFSIVEQREKRKSLIKATTIACARQQIGLLSSTVGPVREDKGLRVQSSTFRENVQRLKEVRQRKDMLEIEGNPSQVTVLGQSAQQIKPVQQEQMLIEEYSDAQNYSSVGNLGGAGSQHIFQIKKRRNKTSRMNSNRIIILDGKRDHSFQRDEIQSQQSQTSSHISSLSANQGFLSFSQNLENQKRQSLLTTHKKKKLLPHSNSTVIQNKLFMPPHQNIFMYDPSADIPKVTFHQLDSQVYSDIFNYNQPLQRAATAGKRGIATQEFALKEVSIQANQQETQAMLQTYSTLNQRMNQVGEGVVRPITTSSQNNGGIVQPRKKPRRQLSTVNLQAGGKVNKVI